MLILIAILVLGWVFIICAGTFLGICFFVGSEHHLKRIAREEAESAEDN